MEQENKGLDVVTDDSFFAKESKEDVLVPDDAFAQGESDEKKKSELLPQSLAVGDDEFPDEEDELFTDEEIASFTQSNSPDFSEEKKNDKADVNELEESSIVSNDSTITKNKEKNGNSKVRTIESCFDILEMFVFALAFVLVAMAFCFRHSVVDGGSMENTLYDREHLIISDLFYSPKNGDIVVVQDLSKAHTSKELAKPIVKRVIATEGQTIMIRSNGEIYVDGELLQEDYVYIDDPEYQYDELPLMTVPEGCVFLMGDHRNVSLDSRSAAGTFSEDAILGKVILRVFPLGDRFGKIE